LSAWFNANDPGYFSGSRTSYCSGGPASNGIGVFGQRAYAEAGGLFSYGANINELCRRAADFVDRIPKGAKLYDLPVEQPTKFELIVNFRTAKAIGVTLPTAILLRADEVIE
jgi:putative tryptophan/tyrosine transport system substrate-binding protein